jgi:hypothetical protein
MERRQHPRLPYDVDVVIEAVDTETDTVRRRVVVRTQDISNGGLACEAPDATLMRDWSVFHPLLWASVAFPEFDAPLRLPVTVAWMRDHEGGSGGAEVGFRFHFPGGDEDFRLSFALARLEASQNPKYSTREF